MMLMAIEMLMAIIMGYHSGEFDVMHHINGNDNIIPSRILILMLMLMGIYNANIDVPSNGNTYDNANNIINGYLSLTYNNIVWDLDTIHHNAIFPMTCGRFLTIFQELINRASKLQLTKKDDPLVMGLKTKGILTEDNKWHYLTWNAEAKALQANQKTPLTSEEICAMLQRIHQLGQNPNLILKFAALRSLKPDNIPQDTAVAIPWRLDISIRGPEALELHTLLLKLAGNGITQLVLMRMRQSTLQRSPLAVAISHQLRRS